jgi:hypothetical protein
VFAYFLQRASIVLFALLRLLRSSSVVINCFDSQVVWQINLRNIGEGGGSEVFLIGVGSCQGTSRFLHRGMKVGTIITATSTELLEDNLQCLILHVLRIFSNIRNSMNRFDIS